MAWWHVEFSIIPLGKQAGDEEGVGMWVEAASSRDALLIGCARLMLADGELIHQAHVSAPREKPRPTHFTHVRHHTKGREGTPMTKPRPAEDSA